MKPKKYTYGIIYKISGFLSFLLAIIFAVIGLLFLCGLILSLFGLGGINSSHIPTLFWGFVGFGVWSPFVFIYMANMNVDIEVEDLGIRIKFLFKSFFVSWNDVDEFKPGKTLGLVPLKRVRVLVTNSALTPFHRLYGLMYGATNKPSLVIGTNISNHEELFKIIENKRKKSN